MLSPYSQKLSAYIIDIFKSRASFFGTVKEVKLSAVTVISVIIDDIAFLKIKTSGKLIIATCLNQFFLFTALTKLLAQSINLLKSNSLNNFFNFKNNYTCYNHNHTKEYYCGIAVCKLGHIVKVHSVPARNKCKRIKYSGNNG